MLSRRRFGAPQAFELSQKIIIKGLMGVPCFAPYGNIAAQVGAEERERPNMCLVPEFRDVKNFARMVMGLADDAMDQDKKFRIIIMPR